MNPAALLGGAIILILIAGSVIFTHTFDSVWNNRQPSSSTISSPTPQLSQEASVAATPNSIASASPKAKISQTSMPKASSSLAATSGVSSSVHIDGVSSSIPFGSVVRVNGTGFGAQKGSFTYFYWDGKQLAGDEILDWDDGHISFVSHFPIGNIEYELQVKTADGKLSNKFKVQSGNGEPLPTIYVLNPSNPVPGRDATIKGINLKNAEKVYFYEEDKGYIGQDIGTSGILEHVRDEEIRYNMPGNLQAGKRYKMSVMSKYGTYGGLMSFTAGS